MLPVRSFLRFLPWEYFVRANPELIRQNSNNYNANDAVLSICRSHFFVNRPSVSNPLFNKRRLQFHAPPFCIWILTAQEPSLIKAIKKFLICPPNLLQPERLSFRQRRSWYKAATLMSVAVKYAAKLHKTKERDKSCSIHIWKEAIDIKNECP